MNKCSDNAIGSKKCNLENRVEILGMVPQNQVQSVLSRGHIFINTSISEAFCIAILEAKYKDDMGLEEA